MNEWKDETSYSRGGDRTPTTWTLRLPTLRITVHRHVHYAPNQWLVTCDRLLGVPQLLASGELEAAKREAIEKLILCVIMARVDLENAEATLRIPTPEVKP